MYLWLWLLQKFRFAQKWCRVRSLCQNCSSGWISEAQRNITLSYSEAKWITLSEAVKENICVIKTLINLEIKVNILITVQVDDNGGMFMSKTLIPQVIQNMLRCAPNISTNIVKIRWSRSCLWTCLIMKLALWQKWIKSFTIGIQIKFESVSIERIWVTSLHNRQMSIAMQNIGLLRYNIDCREGVLK